MKKNKSYKKTETRAMSATYSVSYSHSGDTLSFIELSTPIEVNHCPTCGAKLKKIK